MLLQILLLPVAAFQVAFAAAPCTDRPLQDDDDMSPIGRAPRGVQVLDGGSATIVSQAEFLKEEDAALPEPGRLINKRSSAFAGGRVDRLADQDKGLKLGEARRKREILSVVDMGGATLENLKKRSAESDDGNSTNVVREPATRRIWHFSKASRVVEGSGDGSETIRERRQVEADETVKGSGEGIEMVYSAPSVEDVEGSGDDTGTIRETRQVEGSGDGEELLFTTREARQADEADAVLGDETPVDAAPSPSVQSQGRPDGRHRPSTPRPERPDRPELTCATVDCISGMLCVMENGRPVCRSFPSEPQQRTCRDVNCPRDSRCRMERDPRCRGRDCSEQPVCVREERGASCRNVQCPSGTRCTLVEEQHCRGFRCREVATCVNPCDGVRCPFGTACRFDGRDAICASISINPCLNARCPPGFECRAAQNQAQCFAVNTPAPTTPAPSTCPGQNEEFASCATFCEPNCVEKNPACILACAAPRCQCAHGFYRNAQGVCVLPEQCEFTPSCPLNESYMECSTVCEPRCGQPVNIACPAVCGPAKCQCNQGFWRHPSGSCVQQNQCFFG